MRKPFYTVIDHFMGLFYPRLCLACGQNLLPEQQVVCLSCRFHLPETGFEQHLENIFTEHFWGRIPVHTATALFHFTKGGHTQRLVHQLKYKGKKIIGVQMGKMLGKKLRSSPHYQKIEMILPVPLHARKKKIRGYNQSDFIAKGIAQGMERPWSEKVLQRVQMTSSQTQKSRMERFANVENAFAIQGEASVRGKHVLLVDDVMTTGATLEACGRPLVTAGATLSFATLAFANM